MRKTILTLIALAVLALFAVSCAPGEIGPGKAIAGVASPDVPRHPVYRCFQATNHWLSLDSACTTQEHDNGKNEGIIGYAWDYQVPGSRPLYNHFRISASRQAYRDDFASFDPGCEGQQCGEFLGWVPSGAVTGSKELYRCTIGFDHFVSPDPGCEGQNTEFKFFMLANDLPIANAGKLNKIRNCKNAYAAVYVNILSKTECSKSGGWPDPKEPFIASLFKEPVAGSMKITQCYRQSEDPIAKDFFIVTGSECPASTFKHSTDAITNLGYALESQSPGTVAVHRLWDAYALSRTPPVMDRLKENVFNHRASINPGQYSSSKDEGVFGYWIKNPNNQFIQGLLATTPPAVEVSPPAEPPKEVRCKGEKVDLRLKRGDDFSVGGKNYYIELMYSAPNMAKFLVSGEVTDMLRAGDVFITQDNVAKLTLINARPSEVTFCLDTVAEEGPCADYIAEIAQLRERIDEKKSECDRRIKEMKEKCEKQEDCTEVRVEIESLKKQISDYEKLLNNLKQLLD